MLASLLVIAAAAPAGAGPTGWAHQAAGFQSNGGVTVKSLAGGSYAGTQNPTGAVAKVNQNAATQAPTVIIQATASGTAPIMMWTANTYNGNLGGLTGADAKCQAEFGTGWKFAEIGKLVSGVPYTGGTGNVAWINNVTNGNSCINWTSASGGANGTYLTASGSPAYWGANTGLSCNSAFRLTCVNF